MIYVLAIIVGVCALGAALVALTRRPPRDDVERFHRARAMTTEWSRHYAATGQLELPDGRNGHEPDEVSANGANGQDGSGDRINGRRVREPVEHR